MSRIIRIDGIKPIAEIPKKIRVAVYARVSTDAENQIASLEAQEDYYLKLVAGRAEWTLAGIYADRGISGTSYIKREEFQRMIADCDAGKIDMIITKSISRFARNTVDTINVVRRLKALGIGVKFEKENIWSLDGKGEFVLTLMASFAQEEARSLSENTAWGIRKRMADGKYWVGYSSFLGYGKKFLVEEEGAYTVKLVYKMFLMGYSAYKTITLLNHNDFDTPSGNGKWSISVARYILQNEKYKGDALMQKEYIADFLTKRKVKNKGELPQYYVTGGHEAIIEPVLFDYVQEVFKARAEIRYSGNSLMSSKLRCGKCGAIYGAKVIHSTDKYRHVLWQCRQRFNRDNPCRNRHFREAELPEVYNRIYKRLLQRYPRVKDKCLGAVRDIVTEEERLRKIKKWLRRIPTDDLITDIEEWAMLVENITVYDDKIVLLAFGGEKITMKM